MPRSPAKPKTFPAADPAPPRHGWAYAAFSGLAPLLLMALGLQVPRSPGFSQWDNFEVFFPSILWVHRHVLRGEWPLWNPLQNLGEPIHALGAGAVFYFPYTLATLWVDLLRQDPRVLMDVIAASHVALAGLGLHLLCRSFGVRPLFAMMAGVGGSMCGFLLYLGSIWIHTFAGFAWGVWGAWAIKNVVDGRRPVLSAAIAVLSLTLPFNAGHIQPAVYNVVVTGAFALVYALVRRRPRTLVTLAAIGAAAVLLALPAVLPTATLVPDTVRREAMSAEDFGVRGIGLRVLPVGLLLPVFRGHDGFLDEQYLDTYYAGAWLMPGLIGALLVLLWRRRALDATAPARDGLPIRTGLLVSAGLALAFVLLSAGGQTPLYGLTGSIPFWSSFRWPFKLYLHALPWVLVTGAIGLEVTARAGGGWVRRVAGFVPAVVALACWLVSPGMRGPVALLTGGFGIAGLATVAWIDRRAARALLALATAIGAVGVLILTQRPDRYKTYRLERAQEFGARTFGLEPGYRLVPVSLCEPQGERMQELGLFQSATLDEYPSLTGHRFALTSVRLETVMPTTDDGVLRRGILDRALPSHLLKSFNVRYALAAKNDTTALRALDNAPGWRRHRETERAVVYENPGAFPLLYFASRVETAEAKRAFDGLVHNQVPVDAAFVDDAAPRQFAHKGRVVRSQWGLHRVTAELDSPEDGFLVISMSQSPDWVAKLDGRIVPLQVTNGTIAGVAVPAGARRLELDYEPRSFRAGVRAALAGALILAVTLVLLARGRGRRGPTAPAGA